jgi:hypothetical protein
MPAEQTGSGDRVAASSCAVDSADGLTASGGGSRRQVPKATAFLIRSFFVFRILDARMEHVLQREPEGFRAYFQLAEG